MNDPRSTTNNEGSLRADAKPAVRPHTTLFLAIAAHPVGGVLGALAGLLIGALAGIAAGPVGSLFGALCGAVLGLVLGTGFRTAAGGSAEAMTDRGRR